MLQYRSEIKENGDLIIACFVTDLMGMTISKTYKRFKNLDVYPRNNQEELEHWFQKSKNKEIYF
jgi:hypothetical protein